MNFLIPPWAKYLGALLLVAAIYGKGYSDGKEAERNAWLQKEVAAIEAKVKRETEMQAQVDAAGLALSLSEAELERIKSQSRIETRNYYVTNPNSNVQCLAPERLRSIAESDASAQAANAASKRAE